MEIDIFGFTEDYVIIGDATVRAGVGIIGWIYNRAKKVIMCKPEFKDKKVIIVVHAMYFYPDAIESARKLGIWLFSDSKEVTNLMFMQGRKLVGEA